MSYFGERANDGALNDASQEDEINVFGPSFWWHFFKVVQHLLHGYKETSGAWVRRSFLAFLHTSVHKEEKSQFQKETIAKIKEKCFENSRTLITV